MITKTHKRNGAPPKNRNAMRHGLRAGSLPKGASYIKRECDALRRIIEDEVIRQKPGRISLYDAAIISAAIKWERHGMLIQRWLRQDAADMSPDQKLAYSRDIARAGMERNKCLKLLGLDKDGHDSLDDIYNVPSVPSPASDPDSATEDPPEDESDEEAA